jgi:hypothetical protein
MTGLAALERLMVSYSVAGLSAPPATVPWFHVDGNKLNWGLVLTLTPAGYLIRYH